MSDAFHTPTTDAEFLPEVWSKEVQLARESQLIMSNLVRRFDADVAPYGTIIHVPNVQNIAANNISTADGSLDAVSNQETKSDITINKWKGCVINVLDIVLAQSKYDILSIYTEKLGYALGLVMEQDLMALNPSFSANVGVFNTAVTDATLRAAVQALDDARVPFSDRHLVMKPSVKNNLLSIDKFVRYDAVSYAPGASPIIKGNVGELYGVMAHVSPEVYKSVNNTSNLMFHREAIGLAVQKDVRVEKFARTAFTDRIGGSELYGLAIVRNDHGVEVRS